VTRVEHGRLALDAQTTIFFDEAGMVDTSRLDRLTATIERTVAKFVAIGDGAQLPSIGAAACPIASRRSHQAPSSRTFGARSTRLSRARGPPCARVARIERWRTTSAAANCT